METRKYLSLARPDHWFKNLLFLPGIFIALSLTDVRENDIFKRIIISLLSMCLVSASNYIINEWLDSPFDEYHPVKKSRTAVINNLNLGIVFAEYVFFLTAGLTFSLLVSKKMAVMMVLFAIMAILYNVKPFRIKDIPYLDFICESFNNPVRMTIGWFVVSEVNIPPASIIFSYWMAGAFLMAMKRFSEMYFLGSAEIAGKYRKSFRHYTERSLIISSVTVALIGVVSFAYFAIHYRVELLLEIPLIVGLEAFYLYNGIKDKSSFQFPERFHLKVSTLTMITLLSLSFCLLLFIDIPAMHNIF